MNIPQKSRRFFTGGWTHWGEHLIREHAHCFGDVEMNFGGKGGRMGCPKWVNDGLPSGKLT